jgi:hypothetical protein
MNIYQFNTEYATCYKILDETRFRFNPLHSLETGSYTYSPHLNKEIGGHFKLKEINGTLFLTLALGTQNEKIYKIAAHENGIDLISTTDENDYLKLYYDEIQQNISVLNPSKLEVDFFWSI